MAKSIIQDRKECYICHSQRNLETHHCIFGTANRRLADRDGLTVYLCNRCHRNLHDKGICARELQAIAQRKYEEVIGDDFLERYGRNYIE